MNPGMNILTMNCSVGKFIRVLLILYQILSKAVYIFTDMVLMDYRFYESGSLSPVSGGFWASVKSLLKIILFTLS
jgi:hypothetical protein